MLPHIIVPIGLATSVASLHLLVLFDFVWQQRSFAWPIKDEAALNSTESAYRLMLYNADDGLKFERANILRQFLACAKYYAKHVMLLQLPVVAVCTLLAVTISIVLAGSASWHAWLLANTVPVTFTELDKLSVVLAILLVLPILVCWEAVLFKQIEAKSIRATIASWRFFGCVSYLTCLAILCTFAFYCLLNVRGLDVTSLSLLLEHSLNISMLPFIAFVYSIRIKGWMSDKRLNRADKEYLLQSVITSSALMQKSDYELQELIKCANRMGEFAISQWMGDELLRRSEKLELYDNYNASISAKGVSR